MSAVEPLRVVHLGSARVRIHWPSWWRRGAPSLEEVAARLPAGCRVSGSSVTGNVLVTFDPRTTGPDDVLVALGELDDRDASGAEPPRPPPLLDGEDRAAMARGTIVLGAAILGLGFTLARRAAGDTRRAAESPNLFVTAGLTIAEDLHAVQVGTDRRITGPAPGDLSLKLARVALLASSRSALGLGLLALTSLRAVTAARARERRLLEHTGAVGAPPGSSPGAEVEISEGRGPPIASSVVRGRARALGRSGTWRAVSRGDVLEGGSIVRGGPLTVRVGS